MAITFPPKLPETAKKLLVLVSGVGSNMFALVKAGRAGLMGDGMVAAIVADRDCFAIERARRACVPNFVLDRTPFLSDKITEIAWALEIRLIVLAGFLSRLDGELLYYYRGCIINLHPSLLPKFGGKGMYGLRVHKAVLKAGEQESGCSVHLVTEELDRGTVLLRRRVPVRKWDTPKRLATRVHTQEPAALIEAVRFMLSL